MLGDSFTATVWPRLFANAPVKEVAWMHASARVTGNCDFSFADVERYAPDLIIYARTERFFPCYGDAWPVGLPRPWRSAVPATLRPSGRRHGPTVAGSLTSRPSAEEQIKRRSWTRSRIWRWPWG